MTAKSEDGDLAQALEALYEQVPATRCAQSGECCVLTSEEFDNHYATMFPLYSAEYKNIVAHLERHFDAGRRRALLRFTEERPRRCPFLGKDHGCTIYPVRPLICRTYAVMNHRTIAETAERNRGNLPQEWIDGFVLREGGMVCPRVEVVEPEKLERHSQNLVGFVYERELLRLSQAVELAGGERRSIFARLAPGRRWPLRWTWGGFNALCSAPLAWVRRHFGAYWTSAELVDAG